jgi:2-hydroxychromene-2-carboxylate isomerase
MSKTVEFYFDFGSPAAYLAFTQLPTIASDEGAELVYRPVLLGGIFQATKNASPVTVPAKGSYMLRDFGRFARRYGVPLKFSPFFPINTLTLMRMAIGLQQRQPQDFLPFLNAIFRAMWVDGLNLGDPAILHGVIQKAGFDPDRLQALAQDEAIKALLKQETDKAVQRGLFGVPTMIVGEELFWGQDRLDFVREALMLA